MRFLLVVLLPSVASAQGRAPLFPAPIDLVAQPEEFSWMAVRLGDVTGDGLLDAVVATHSAFGGGGGVSVCAGDASGGLGAPVSYGLGCCSGVLPYDYTIADLDGDGRLDVVASTSQIGGGNAVGVLRGNAQGTLDAAIYYPTPSSGSIAVGDVTGDGRRDVVIRKPGSVCVLAQNALGGLDPEACTSVPGNFGLLRIGDVTGDGRLDVVTVGGNPANVGVLAGNAQGTLNAPLYYAAGGDYPIGLALADVNRDGHLDVVLAQQLEGICVLAGNAQGTLDSPVCQLLAGQPEGLAVGDANGDAFVDVVTWYTGTVALLRGTSSGSFAAPVTYRPRTFWYLSGAIGDLANDGRPDVVFANGPTLDLCTLRWDGQSGLDAGDAYPTTGLSRPALGDVTGDGRTDVVLLSSTGGTAVCVLAGNAAHRLDPEVRYPIGGGTPTWFVVGDVSGDGRLDVVVDTTSGILVLTGNAQGTLDAPVGYPAADGIPAIGDVTGDGRMDLVVSTSTGVCVLAGNLQGTLDPPQCTPAAQGNLVLGDVTGDGRLDAVVVTVNAAAQAYVLAGNAQGTLDPPVGYPLNQDYATGVALGEVTGDGRTDVVVAMGYGFVCILAGNAQGTLDPVSTQPVGWILAGMALADVGGDGRLDLVMPEYKTDSGGVRYDTWVSVREQNAQGGFGAEQLYGCGSPWGLGAIALGDLTGDGRPDVVGGSFPLVVVLENEAPALGTRACFGTGCPCGNDGAGGRGCQNSIATGGARLYGEGAASLANDTARLLASGELASAFTLFVQGDATIPAVNYGDGLRCTGGALKRIFSRSASAGAVTVPGPGDVTISARSAALGDALSPGAVRVYQAYYRDPNPNFCAAPTGSTFNVTSSLTMTWAP
jgi:hypothetical protein